ncbi:metallophosphoesterase [Prosthecobacter sp. SYSU 5D2]|uniref:metallophosphoesterase family protein n=1 Tax=Prosthecobacter sp. SYSU 5D2 TaxID=3134134 RepID=UPI0031FE5507
MKTSNLRWLHVSDLHVGMDDYAQRSMFEYIKSHVKKRKEEGFIPDFLFVTGDLANKGLSSEYETFWLEFIAPLQEVIGNGIEHRTFVVPGNHDVNRKVNPHFDRAEMADPKSHCFDANDEGLDLRTILLPRFKAFIDSDSTVAEGMFGKPEGSFTNLSEINNLKVGIAGINTAWLCKDDQDERKLTPGKTLLEHSLIQLGDIDLTIVLGHHPLEWLAPGEQKAIKSILARHHALYLHGHLHNVWAEPSYGSGHKFLTVQAGAAFQAREGEKWRNGIVWGEVDFTTGILNLQARHWSYDNQDWPLVSDAFPDYNRTGDWWAYPLPGTETKGLSKHVTISEPLLPSGWITVKPDDLQQYYVTLQEEVAIQFFNGAVPGWSAALSTSIPRRKIVEKLIASFQNAETFGRSIVTLLLASGCEGKTTALLQTAGEFVKCKSNWRILRRVDDAEPLKPTEILPILSGDFYWLVVIDEADRTAETIISLLRQIPTYLHGRVHFLLACRDSDWIASKANDLPWASNCSFSQHRLEGLSAEEATLIVSAWTSYGEKGLGDLTKTPVEDRATVLEKQVYQEAKTSEGAFFGALLAVRHGSDLPNHARLMLERLEQRKIPSGGTVRDALTIIAAMHSEGLEFLSRPVLAHVLSCPLAKLHRDVLLPLGQEAAATTTSSYIFTRHKKIADAIVSILEKDFGEDMADLFVSLGKSAIESYKGGQTVPELAKWRFELAEHFCLSGRTHAGLEIAIGVYSSEQDNYKTLVNTANLFRKAEMPDKALDLFRKFPPFAHKGRAFYFEWSRSEAEMDNLADAAILAAFSVSDDCVDIRVQSDHALKALNGLCVSFSSLFLAYRDAVFLRAKIGVAIIGHHLSLSDQDIEKFDKHMKGTGTLNISIDSVDHAFLALIDGINAANFSGISQKIATEIPNIKNLCFEGLERLVEASNK